jgi:PAS domain S-box-containing protein
MQAWYSSFRSAGSLAWLGISTALSIGLLALIGTLLDVRLLTSVRPEWMTMRVITATCLVLSALELAFLHANPLSVRKFIALQVPGILDILVGSLTVALYAFAIITGREPPLEGAGILNLFWNPSTRMALMTAITLVFIGCALVLLTKGSRRASDVAHTLMLPALAMSYLVPVSYFFGIQDVYAWMGIPMAINTGVALCALGVGILCACPDTWIMRVFTADHAGSVMARRLLPVILLIPLLIGWLKLYVAECGAIMSDAEASIVTVAYTFCLLCIVWLTAASLNRVDAERRESEEAVRQSEARLKIAEAIKRERQRLLEVLETLPTMICLLKPDYKVAFANRSFREKFGEAHGRPCYEYRFGGSEPCAFCQTGKVLETGLPNHWELIGPDGSIIDAYNFPFTDVDGSPMILEMDIDITERRRAERELIEIKENLEQRVAERTAKLAASEEKLRVQNLALHQSEEKYRVLFEHMNEIMAIDEMVFDERGNPSDWRILDVNPAYVQAMGKPREDIVGRLASEVYEGDPPEPFLRRFAHIVRTREPVQFEEYFNPLHVQLLVSAFPLGGPRFATLTTDISKRKRMEQALRKSHDDLELRVQERTADLEWANEKLRLVPSRLIQAQENERQRLAMDLHDSVGQTLAALKFRIEHVIISLEKEECTQALNLLHDYIPILQHSIDETRTIYMGLKPTVLAEHGVLATLEWYRREILSLYPDQHIELETAIIEKDIPEDLKTPIFRIVQEALNNAFKHGKPEWVDVRLSVNNDAIELEISDDGIGMDVDHILESSTAKSLGLIGMKERAELTGGDFMVKSAPNEGTTVKALWRNDTQVAPRAVSMKG